jgi:hypothetical protein
MSRLYGSSYWWASDVAGSACSARVHTPGPSARCNWGLPQPHVRLTVRRRVRRPGDSVDTIQRKGQSPRPGKWRPLKGFVAVIGMNSHFSGICPEALARQALLRLGHIKRFRRGSQDQAAVRGSPGGPETAPLSSQRYAGPTAAAYQIGARQITVRTFVRTFLGSHAKRRIAERA